MHHPQNNNGISSQAQYRQWVVKWKREYTEESPSDHIGVIQFCDPAVFPTIHALLTIASILPISTATVERTFSTLRLVNTYLRNRTLEDRLNGLTLMYIYGTDDVDVDSIIDRFANLKNRRLLKILKQDCSLILFSSGTARPLGLQGLQLFGKGNFPRC